MLYQEKHLAAGLAAELRLYSDTGSIAHILPNRVTDGLRLLLKGAALHPGNPAQAVALGEGLRIELRTYQLTIALGVFTYTPGIRPFIYGCIAHNTKFIKQGNRRLRRYEAQLNGGEGRTV